MKTIVEVLKEIKAKHPGMILSDDGKNVWSVEELLFRAEDDVLEGEKGAGDQAYFWGYTADGLVSIAKYVPGVPVFTVLTQPTETLKRRPVGKPYTIQMKKIPGKKIRFDIKDF